MLMDDLENDISSYCLAFCEVIQFRIMEAAATREHHIHFRATCRKREEVKCVPPFSVFFLLWERNQLLKYV